jgi:hypothetical protein
VFADPPLGVRAGVIDDIQETAVDWHGGLRPVRSGHSFVTMDE